MKGVSLALVVVAALGGVAFGDDKNPDVSAADAARFVAFFDQVVDTVATNKDDCGNMTKALNTLFDANTALIADANKAKDDGKHLPKSSDEHIAAGAQRMVGDLKKCAPDKPVQEAFKRLDKK
jgi:hypothetical protein